MFGNVPPACVAAEFLGTLLFQFFGGAASANSHAHGDVLEKETRFALVACTPYFDWVCQSQSAAN